MQMIALWKDMHILALWKGMHMVALWKGMHIIALWKGKQEDVSSRKRKVARTLVDELFGDVALQEAAVLHSGCDGFDRLSRRSHRCARGVSCMHGVMRMELHDKLHGRHRLERSVAPRTIVQAGHTSSGLEE
jgi:hypothetical protein